MLFQKAVSSMAKTDPSQLVAVLYSYGAGMGHDLTYMIAVSLINRQPVIDDF